MDEAVSMYFGGDIISAAECDYSTSRKLGLICPFCSSAVFIRSASIRQINGKEKLVDQYFAHYPSDSPDNWDCDKRSHTIRGRQEIERIKLAARNQRLRLYNGHLWQMFADAQGLHSSSLNGVRKSFGQAWIDSTSVLIRHEWAKSIDSVYTFIDAAFHDVAAVAVKDHFTLSCDERMHKAVCYEIADFLGTNTAGFVFAKLFKFSLLSQIRAADKDWNASRIRRLSPVAHISAIAIALTSTDWITQIKRQLGEDQWHRNTATPCR